jgi:hypothetical protein
VKSVKHGGYCRCCGERRSTRGGLCEDCTDFHERSGTASEQRVREANAGARFTGILIGSAGSVALAALVGLLHRKT